ncbi:MAG: PilZ domain-containing protein [Deltaproteobacteria bacterium]|nr:PilZ domain-containing protein [Deltaproteobacteria bacterium]MBW2071386.1 PilZ domain-containing protein [Deltaproteobacteria bacterium]
MCSLRPKAPSKVSKKTGKSFPERRNYLRLLRTFNVKIHIEGTSTEVEGVTCNISQKGSFVRSPSWAILREHDHTVVTLRLPPEMTGQPKTLNLIGPAVVKRIDKERNGIAFEFLRELRTFKSLL